MSSDPYYQHHPRTVIPVTVNPNDDQRFFRIRSSNAPPNDIPDRMSLRMRDFEEDCRRWRERFFNEPRFESDGFPLSSSAMQSKPRMRVDFPDFPEFGSIDWPTFRGPAPGSGPPSGGATQRSFIEEDNEGRKRYKVQFDIGEFRPEEINVRVAGRMLIVKGDRQVKVGNATESKQFNRELTLPEFVDGQTVQSYLSDDGVLTMEAPVLLDRLYNDSSSSAIAQHPQRIVDTTFTGGRQPTSNYNYGNNNQTNSYSSTSSSSSFRQEGSALRDADTFHRNSPLRDPYSSSTSSASTLVGGSHFNNQGTAPFSTTSSRPDHFASDNPPNIVYKFDLSQFDAENIAIQVDDTVLKVTALKEERDGRGSTHREFRREIGLPDGAQAKNLTNTFGSDGMLTITIPVRELRPTLQSQGRHLPANIGTNDSFSTGGQQLRLTFDLSGYKPDEVTVKVKDNVLKVQAAHVDNTNGKQINREYMREHVLPDGVDVDNLRAQMSEDSTLTVEVPIPHDRVHSLNRPIKITDY